MTVRSARSMRWCASLLALVVLVIASSRAHAAPKSTPDPIARAFGAPPAGRAIAAEFDGALEVEGHLADPHDVVRYRSHRRIACVGPDRVRQDWTTWTEGDSTRSVETTLLIGDRVLRRDEASSPFHELAGRDAVEAARTVRAALPALLYAEARARDVAEVRGGRGVAFSWADARGQVWTVSSRRDGTPLMLGADRADPWRGDLDQRFVYRGGSRVDGVWWPDSLSSQGFPRDYSWRMEERRAPASVAPPLADLATPERVVSDTNAAALDSVPRVERIADRVWSIDLPDIDTRSLVLEFGDHLAVLETGLDVDHGEALRAAIRARVSRKPIRLVSFGHHHPHYTGGLRAFLADSATVVCAGRNAAYVREIAHLRFTRAPDRLERRHHGRFEPVIDTLDASRWSHADELNQLEILDIGPASNHTSAYLVFYLPRAKLLFEGDLGYFTTDGQLRASRRCEGMMQAVAAAGFDVERVVQGWPVNGNPPSVSAVELRALIAARSKK